MNFSKSLKALFLCLLTIGAINFTQAQIQVPNATSGVLNQTGVDNNIIIDNSNLTRNTLNAWNELEVNSQNVDYGNSTAVTATSTADGGGGPATGIGLTRGSLSYLSKYNAGSGFYGVVGQADSISLLNVFDNTTASSAIGGNFSVNILDPLVNPTTGTYTIAGSYSSLRGNITNYPTNGVVSAVVGVDEIKGTDTWAGHFDGRGHFSQNVGIATTNPQSLLSVNGDGNSIHTVYAYTDGTTSGNAAVLGQSAQPTNFGGSSTGVQGLTESGYGYAYGVRGTATTATPSSDGRAYGVSGIAGNADINYAVYGNLTGSNRGAAVFGSTDAITSPSALFNGQWAGYFVGDVNVTDRVGIGCSNLAPAIIPTTTTYRLIVDGGILGKELFINNTAWCDYVFEEDYTLTSLEEVETHIQEKGHLHNTPSAVTIEEAGGIELGEMTRNQQEKIEEIYLHLIELNKEVKSLKAENAELKSKLIQGK